MADEEKEREGQRRRHFYFSRCFEKKIEKRRRRAARSRLGDQGGQARAEAGRRQAVTRARGGGAEGRLAGLQESFERLGECFTEI